MQEVRRETGVLSDTLGGIGHVGRNMTLAVTAPLAALATGAITAAATFDASMRNINSIAFLTEDQLKGLADRVLDFGSSIRSGPHAAAEALNSVFQAGITDVDTAFMVMQTGAKTAEAGLADLTKTTEGLVAAALTFGDQTPAALKKYSDATTLAVQLGVGSMNTFNTAFANAMGSAAAVGDSFESMSAAIAFLTQRGIGAASAGTYLNNVYSKLIQPTEELNSIFTRLGVSSGRQLIETFGGVEGGLRAIYKLIGDDETVWAKLFPDVRGFKAVSRFFTAFSEDGKDAVSEFFGAFADKMAAGGVTMAAWEQQMMSFEAQWDLLTSSATGFAITIGNILLPVLTPVIQGFTSFIQNLQQTDPALLKVGVAMAFVAAAAGPLLWLLGSLVSPVALLAAAAAGLAVAFTTNFGGIQDTVRNAVTEIFGPLDDLKNGINTFISTLFGDTQQAATDAVGKTTPVTVSTADIITVEEPKSLWQIFTENGYDQKMSWQQFMADAAAGGWTGGPVKPGDTIKIPINITPDLKFDSPVQQDKFNLKNNDPAEALAPVDNSIGGRIAAAFNAAWPTIQPALEGMWNNIKTWFDETAIPSLDTLGGDAINSIAGWFSTDGSTGQGDSPVYNAIKGLLSGDIGAAAANVGTWVDEHFPKVKESLGKLVSNIGTWISDEGVPTIARSIGYFAGQVAVTIGQALGSVWNGITTFIGGGQTGRLGDGVVEKTLSSVNNSIIQPMTQGVSDAFADAGVENPLDQFVSGLAGAIVTALTGATFVQMLLGKGLVGALLGTLSTAFGLALKGGVALLTLGASVVNGIGTAISFAAANILPAAGWLLSTAASILASIASAIIASPIAIGIAIGSILYIAIPPEVREALQNAIKNLLDGIFGEGTTQNIQQGFERSFYDAFGRIAGALGNHELETTLLTWSGAIQPDVTIEPAEGSVVEATNAFMDSVQAAASAETPIQVPATIVPTAVPGNNYDNSFDVPLPDGEPIPLDWSKLFTIDTTAQPPAPPDMTPVVSSVDEGLQLAAQQTQADREKIGNDLITDVAVGAATAIQTAVAAGGAADTTAIAQAAVQPVVDAFTGAFGEEGTARLAFNDFTTSVATNITSILADLMKFQQATVFVTTTAQTAFTRLQKGVTDAVYLMQQSIIGLVNSMQSVGKALATMPMVGVTGGGGTINSDPGTGGNASGGTAEGWRIVGERGPELAYFGGKGTIMPTRMLRDSLGGGGGGDTYVNVYVDGVQNVDDFLFELERRGYSISR